MTLSTRATTLAAAQCDAGVRVYIKKIDGSVHETCHPTDKSTLSKAVEAKNTKVLTYSEGWTPSGDSPLKCSQDSALCSVSGANWNQAIFYQDAKGCLRERRHANQWYDTAFVEKECLVGTNIAAVHTPYGYHIMLFFQAADGCICYRTATCSLFSSFPANWSKTKSIAKAALGTGIAAVASEDLKDVKLYFQTEDKSIQEWKGDGSGNWAATGHAFKCTHLVGDITAISWGHQSKQEIRLYYQNEQHWIVEQAFTSGKGWYIGEFKEEAMPSTDIIAFVRKVSTGAGFCINVLWAGQDQTLHQRVYVPGMNWLPVTSVGSLRNTSESIGCWTSRQYFSDEAPDSDRDGIDTVTVYSNKSGVVGIALEYDSKIVKSHGSSSGKKDTFVLEDHEDITHVWYDGSVEGIRGIQFGTTKNATTTDGTAKQRKSPWFGVEDKPDGVWTRGGYALGGFQGAEYYGSLTGLAPIWTTRVRGVAAEHLESVKKEGESLAQAVKTSADKLKGMEDRVQKTKDAFDAAIAPLAVDAMATFVKAAKSIEYFRDLGVLLRNAKLGADEQRTKDIKAQHRTCKEHADQVEDALQMLKDKCSSLAPEIDALVAAIEKTDKVIEKNEEDLANFIAKTDILIKGLAFRMEPLEDLIAYEKLSIKLYNEQATSAKTMLEKHESKQSAATLSDIDRFRKNESEARAKLDDAEKRLTGLLEEEHRKATVDLTALKNLRKTVEDALQTAKTTHDTVHQLREASALFNTTSDKFAETVAVVFSESKPLDSHETAKEFAKALLHILHDALQVDRLREALRFDATQLETVLEGIANSN